MIARVWHGWTTPENADTYENILNNEVIPLIESYNMDGYKEIQVLKREHPSEVEFITIMLFDSLDKIKQFVGEDYEVAHVPKAAQKVLKRYDSHSQHYEIRNSYKY